MRAVRQPWQSRPQLARLSTKWPLIARALQVPPSLELAVFYTREVGAGVERIWENVFDWEHLPVLHEMYFNAVELIEIGDWGWRVALTEESRHARPAPGPRDAGGPRGRPIPRADPRRRRRGDRDLDIAEGAGTASDGPRGAVLPARAGSATARSTRRQIPRQLRAAVGRGRGDDDASRGNDRARRTAEPGLRGSRFAWPFSRAAAAPADTRRV